MYHLNDKQVDRILDDIRARGVEMEDLQLNLLDHVCCIIEQNLEENGDFESFYQSTIKTFYKNELWEIEEETLTLLTFKNYYIMKKTMILSGAAASFWMILGIIFKFSFWPGANVLLVLGVLTGSLVFLPLLFTLKAREKQSTKDKLALGLGAFAAILMSLSFLFKVMHWPGAMVMVYVSSIVMLLVFLPIHFFSGIRNADTKINTITSSVLIVMAYCLLLILVRTPRASHVLNVKSTHEYLRSQQIVDTEQRQLQKQYKGETASVLKMELGNKISQACEDARSFIVERETGERRIDENFESKNLVINDHTFEDDPAWDRKLAQLTALVVEYNTKIEAVKTPGMVKIPIQKSILDPANAGSNNLPTFLLLNQLIQVQMFVLQNQRELLAAK